MRCAIAFAALLLASRADAADNWTYGASEHFEVYTTGGAGTARDSLTYFERIHAFFAEAMRLSPRQKTPTRLIIFSNDKQFAPYRPNDVAAAFYQPGADRDYIVMGRFDAESDDIVAHEYVHLLIKYGGAQFPVWLNEGLAEFYSTATPDGGKMNYGKVPRDRLLYLRSGVALMDLGRLFAVGHDSPEYNTRSHVGVFYSESWALTHMLAMDDRYRPSWPAFQERMARGMGAVEALQQAYNKTPDVVARDLVNYITQDQYLYRQTSYKLPADTKYVTRPADAFEAELVTANLLANSPKGEEPARAAFTRLEQQKPNDVALLESRAYFEWRRGKRDAALPYFARAVEQGSRNARLMMDYSRLDPSKSASLVTRALALAPDDTDVRIEHARQLLRDGKSDEAIGSFQGLSSLDREQAFEIAQIAANAYLQLNRLSDARDAAALVAAYADEGPQMEFARRLSKGIEDYAAQRAAFEQRAQASAAAAGTPQTAASAADAVRAPLITNATPPAAEPIVTVAGRIRNIVCRNGETILEVLAGGQTLALFIDRPKAITVMGQPGFEVDLKCEPQDVPITVGYKPGIDPARKTIGYVRVLDYRK